MVYCSQMRAVYLVYCAIRSSMCSTSKSRTRAPHLLLKMSTGHSSVRLNRFTLLVIGARRKYGRSLRWICRDIFVVFRTPPALRAFPRTYVRVLPDIHRDILVTFLPVLCTTFLHCLPPAYASIADDRQYKKNSEKCPSRQKNHQNICVCAIFVVILQPNLN